MTGAMILVVGPSGVGKDTLLDGVRTLYAGDSRFHFLTREITRSTEAGGEDHVPVSIDEFNTRRASGVYALNWGAHALHYGLPHAEMEAMRQGVCIVANGSRGVLEEARAMFPRLAIISINASEDVLRARLIARGRENIDDIERRIARARAFSVTGAEVIEIDNDGDVEEGVARLAEALARADGRLFGMRGGEGVAWPRPGAFLITRRGDKILFAHDDKGRLHLPGGGLEPGEDHIAALRREAMEETGMKIVGDIKHLCDASAYHDVAGLTDRHKINRYFTAEAIEVGPPSERGYSARWRAPDEVWAELEEQVRHALVQFRRVVE